MNRKRLKHSLVELGRIDIFKELDDIDVELLGPHIETRFYATGSTIFSPGDLADTLYVVLEGEVEMEAPKGSDAKPTIIKENDSFGRAAVFTGCPFSVRAVAKQNTWVSAIPREILSQLMEESPSYRDAVLAWLRSDEIDGYLRNRQQLTKPRINEWLEKLDEHLEGSRHLPHAKKVVRHEEAFEDMAGKLERIAWLEDMGEEECEAFADHLIYRKYTDGEMLFEQMEPADYLYIIESGKVLVNDEEEPNRFHHQGRGDAIGSRAFLSGLRHTVSARAHGEVTVWSLRRYDLGELLEEHPEFRFRLVQYLRNNMLSPYQQQRYGLNQAKVMAWTDKAVSLIKHGKMPPSMLEMGVESTKSHGAALAIWLGILLDGIPESLVIGANMIHSSISLSLVAGLFLSNYPEALSSSFGMREEGMSKSKIVIMWSSIMLFTGIGAAMGNLMMAAAGPHWFAFLEGLAAGAMFTMIAQTMLPEAYSKGGSITGFATLMGFLCTISLKTIGD